MNASDRASLPNTSEVGSEPRHRWFPVKEAFSPRFVREAIGGGSNQSHVIDPFCGSGTVLVEASRHERPCTGFEVNPFLHFVTRAKLRTCKAATLEDAAKAIQRAMRKPIVSPLEGTSTFTERENLRAWLFNRQILRSFEAGWLATSAFAPNVRDLLQLALLSASMENCNAKRDGKCLRYKKNWEKLTYDSSSLEQSFTEEILVIKEDLEACPLSTKSARIIKGDVRKSLVDWDGHFLHCVTSPPYLNSFDYNDIYRPELFLGKFVENNLELRKFRMSAIRSHVQARWDEPANDSFGYLYRACISQLRESTKLWDKRLPMMVQAYFEDMDLLLGALQQRGSKGSEIWLVVSTSAYAGVEIPVDLILAEAATNRGWRLKDILVLRDLRSSSQLYSFGKAAKKRTLLLRESAVILRKN